MSLKIEGRMKQPEYTAAVTGIYRKYLDILKKIRIPIRWMLRIGNIFWRYLTEAVPAPDIINNRTALPWWLFPIIKTGDISVPLKQKKEK